MTTAALLQSFFAVRRVKMVFWSDVVCRVSIGILPPKVVRAICNFCNLPLGDSAHRRTCRLRFRQSFWQGMETFVQLFSLVSSAVHACQLLHFGHFGVVRRFQRKHCCIFDEKHKNTQPLLKQLAAAPSKIRHGTNICARLFVEAKK